MPDDPIQPAPDAEPQVPPRLAADLSRLFAAGAVPPAVDEAILRGAGLHFARRRRTRRLLLAAGPLAAAAGLAVAVWLLPGTRPASPVPAAVVGLAGDLNGDGRTDIVDALVLASAIRDGGELSPAWDLTGDRAVTRDDVDAIATIAVRLATADAVGKGGAS